MDKYERGLQPLPRDHVYTRAPPAGRERLEDRQTQISPTNVIHTRLGRTWYSVSSLHLFVDKSPQLQKVIEQENVTEKMPPTPSLTLRTSFWATS